MGIRGEVVFLVGTVSCPHECLVQTHVLEVPVRTCVILGCHGRDNLGRARTDLQSGLAGAGSARLVTSVALNMKTCLSFAL